MAILFMDSFSGYMTADIPTRWVGENAHASIVNTPLPPGSQAGAQILQLSSGSGNGSVVGNNYGSQPRMIQGFRYYRAGSGGNASGAIAGFCYPAGLGTFGIEAYFACDNSGSYLYSGNGTRLGTGPVVTPNEWHHYELDVLFGSAANATLKLYVDGNPTPSIVVTGATLPNATANQSFLGGGFQGGQPSNADGYYADFYLFNSSGAAPENAALAPQSISGQALGAPKMAFTVPNGPGRISNWTANGAATIWQSINQVPQDGDTTYAASSTVNNAFMVTLGAVPSMTTLIAVQVSNYAREDDAGPRSYQSGFGNGVSETYSGMDQFLGGTYNYIEDEFPLNPITGLQWVPGDLAGLQVGLKLTN
jgi:hypothetical protein